MTTEVKKRGRKAKDPTNTDSNKNTENIPKKRGRKPKGGKIIQQDICKTEQVEAAPNIILHLKCSLDDINNTTTFNCIEPNDSNVLYHTKNSELNFHFIDTDTLHTVTTNMSLFL